LTALFVLLTGAIIRSVGIRPKSAVIEGVEARTQACIVQGNRASASQAAVDRQDGKRHSERLSSDEPVSLAHAGSKENTGRPPNAAAAPFKSSTRVL